MDSIYGRSVVFHAPPQSLDTPSGSSLTMAISSAMEADKPQAFLLGQNCWSEQSIFESALTSFVSSAATTETNSGDNTSVTGELIGKLPIFGNDSSAEFSHSSYPLPELILPAMMVPIPTAAPEVADVGRWNRTAQTSAADGSVQRVERVASLVAVGSRDGSEFSDRFPREFSRKRKCLTEGKGKECSAGILISKDPRKNSKRIKPKDENPIGKLEKISKSDDAKPPEKEYIHVRARRGQATDSHSLAERVRREKISERMKLLQNLVPGCNKVNGKALMLEEIINYVQSLQRQVEFLSMKLASVNSCLDIPMDSLMSENTIEPNICSSQSQEVCEYDSPAASRFSGQLIDRYALRSQHKMPPPAEQCYQNTPQFCEDDLQAFVQMGFRQNQSPHCKKKNIV